MKAWPLHIILFFCWNAACSQEFPNIRFNYLTAKDGLSSNEVSWITQDNEGFIWIGTGDGLNRFDGYRVKRFFHNAANENSLVNNSVYQISADQGNRLWITTREGFTVYDKKTAAFRNFRHNPADSSTLENDQFNSIYTTDNNDGWVTTPFSVYHFDSSLRYRKISIETDKAQNNQNGSYENLTRDRNGNLWASHKDYLMLIDKKTMQVAKRFGPLKGNVEAIYEDTDLQFWIGSFGGGLLKFDPKNGMASEVKLSSPSMIVHSIAEWWDQHHTRWLVLGSDNGLILVNPASLASKEYKFHIGYFPEQMLTKSVAQHVYVDRQNILWVGTEGGVAYALPSRQLFDLWNISNATGILPAAASDWIYSICETTDGYWMTRWVGTGLYHFNKEGVLIDTINKVLTRKGYYALSDSLKPYYIFSQGDSILWFTTNSCLVHFNLGSKKAIFYKPPDGDSFTGLRTILEIDNHTWWIRTRNNGSNGIYIFDPVAGTFRRHFTYLPGCSGCVPSKLLTMFLTKKMELYITAVGEGLFRYDPVSTHFIPIFKYQGNDLKQHSNSFESIAEDNGGRLWITSYTGVFVYDPVQKKVIKDYTSNEQLGGVEVSGITLDDHQNAWLNSERGIFYILHSTGELRQLTNTEGLTNNSNGIFQQAKDHSLFTGLQGFLLHIRPSELLESHPQTVAVHFSEATVIDTPTFFHFASSGQKEMIIEPGENRFTVDFSVMNYDGHNRYYYRLEGAMNSWQENENGHLAFYNLSPGKYTLHVKGGNKYGEVLSSEDEVVIIVQPYWWQTIWFKLFCAALIVSLAALLTRRRIIHIRREAAFKQKIAETEMMALRSQMNPHFIFNSLNSIENFMMRNEKRLASDYLNKFARLIRMILDSSRNELVPLAKDMEALRLYVDLEQLRFDHKFCFTLKVDPLLLSGDYKVPALLIQPYVENAIAHGFAHSERNDLRLKVDAFLKEDYIHYTVEDNGIGRELSSIYNHQNKPHHKSFGLTITKERIHIFNQKRQGDGGINITDLFDENNQPSGTKVEIMIKAI